MPNKMHDANAAGESSAREAKADAVAVQTAQPTPAKVANPVPVPVAPTISNPTPATPRVANPAPAEIQTAERIPEVSPPDHATAASKTPLEDRDRNRQIAAAERGPAPDAYVVTDFAGSLLHNGRTYRAGEQITLTPEAAASLGKSVRRAT